MVEESAYFPTSDKFPLYSYASSGVSGGTGFNDRAYQRPQSLFNGPPLMSLDDAPWGAQTTVDNLAVKAHQGGKVAITEGLFLDSRRQTELPRTSIDVDSAQAVDQHAISQSEASETDRVSAPDTSESIYEIRLKHDIVKSLMLDVYIALGPQGDAKYNECAEPSKQSSAGSFSNSSSSASSTHRLGSSGKRAARDENSPPRDDKGGKRARHPSSGANSGVKRPPFACPFYKYDPIKYRSTSVTGTRYRTCMGPGYETISRLKYKLFFPLRLYEGADLIRQHLSRTHRPIQCPRCWVIMKSSSELHAHLNAETRCEQQFAQPEGIDQTKMDHILSQWGATWEGIFEILFPGAQIPSPCIAIVHWLCCIILTCVRLATRSPTNSRAASNLF